MKKSGLRRMKLELSEKLFYICCQNLCVSNSTRMLIVDHTIFRIFWRPLNIFQSWKHLCIAHTYISNLEPKEHSQDEGRISYATVHRKNSVFYNTRKINKGTYKLVEYYVFSRHIISYKT